MTWDPVSAGTPRQPRGKGGKQGRAATGRRAIPPGVRAAVQAEALARAGEPGAQTAIAEAHGVSRWYVARLMKDASGTDPEAILTLRKALPDRLTVMAAGFVEAGIEALAEGDVGTATKSAFGAKLNVESMRHLTAGAGEAGGTVQAFIDALHRAGGGTLTVAVEGPVTVEAEVTAVHPASPEDQTPMPT